MKLGPRNVFLLTSHAQSYMCLRRFPEALRKLDQVLDIVPDDVDTLARRAGIAQAEGDLPRASALLAPLHPGPTARDLQCPIEKDAIAGPIPIEILARVAAGRRT